MLAIMQGLSNTDNNPPTDDTPPPKTAVNAAVQDSFQLEMLCLLCEISRDRQGGSGDRNSSGGRGERDGGRTRVRKTSDNARSICRKIDLYCWTHGGYNHLSKDFLHKANGHKDNVTKANCMGRSNVFTYH